MACGLFQNVVPLLEMWSHMFQMQRSKDSQVGGQQKDSINVVVEVTYLSVYFIYLTSQIDPDISNHSPVGLVRCSLTLIAAGLYEVLESGHAIVFYNRQTL
jgi:hypothetical protein